MEEWVGAQWHRLITHLADDGHPEASVTLDEMARPITLLFRAGGGASTLRIAPAAAQGVGGPRGWLQRVAEIGRAHV